MSTRPLALSMGEPGGIAGEITLAAWQALQDDPRHCFFTIADPAELRRLAGTNIQISEITAPQEAPAAFQAGLPVIAETLPEPVTPGQANAGNAAATLRALQRAAVFVRNGEAACLVTNPIDKAVLHEHAGFSWPGHTEYLADLANSPFPPVMMLAASRLRVIPVTTHIALRQVAETLTGEAILHAARLANHALQTYFDIPRPRLAIAGLNPHAGEGGLLGDEEINLIAPAVEQLQTEGLDASGPWSPDTMFLPDNLASYDAAICMYHDQALIPVKAIDFAATVNVTLGLPFLRTSPGHGVAYSLAGKECANAAPLVAALRLAARMAAAGS